MNRKNNASIYIPAHLGSKRLKNKLLLKRTGKPLLQHTYEQACRAECAAEVKIATDSREIAEAAKEFGADVVMTGAATSGTDRIAEAVAKAGAANIVVNVQGDEPEIDPDHIDLVVRRLERESTVQIATLAAPLHDWKAILDPNQVKVVFNYHHQAMYFSRAIIPFHRDEKPKTPPTDAYFGHIGLYAYRKEVLSLYSKLPHPMSGQLEHLEQHKALHFALSVAVEVVDSAAKGIDTEEDYLRFIGRQSPER